MSGQYIEVKTQTGKSFAGYLAIAEGGKGPGIVLCQEIFGVNAAMRIKADFLAEEGYTVLVPDLFWRTAPRIELGYTEQDFQKAFELYQLSKDILNKYVPWEAARCENIELTDAGGYLSGRFPPGVRKPILTLPSGRKVFGMADALVVNDPITGQGSNNAAKCSKIYFDAILAHDNQTFTDEWMQQTFERYWAYAEKVVAWTNSLLLPPQPHMIELLAAAEQNHAIASSIANNFDNPRNFAPWWFDSEQAQRFIESKSCQKVA